MEIERIDTFLTMKRILQFFIIATMCCCVSTSCEKGETGKPKVGSMEDLLGTYSVTVEENVFWGGDSGIIYDKGTITITRLDKNRVQLRGLISTKGELINGKLYLDSETNTDSYGYLSTTYSDALFGGGILTIWSDTSGRLATTPNGTLYSYRSLCYFEGRKIEQ